MGFITPLNSYSKKQVAVSKIAKAISHPARIAIIDLLNKNDHTCFDIINELPLAQSTVSQHLIELKKTQLISGVDRPPKMVYKLNKKVYNESKELLNSFFLLV